MIKKIIIALVIVAVAGVAIKTLLKQKSEIQTQERPQMMRYSVALTTPVQKVLEQKKSYLAQVLSDTEINVATKMSATIEKLYVSESDSVKKGDILVKIDDTTLQNRLNTLKEKLKVQKQDILYYVSIEKRNKKLFEADAISKEKYDASSLSLLNKRAIYDATKESIDSVVSDLAYLSIRAPLSGVVSKVYMHEGDLAVASKPLVMINSYAKKVNFSYAEDKDSIAVDNSVYHKGKKIGTITKIYPNAQNNLNVAEVALSEELTYKSGSFISIDVALREMSGCSVGVDSLLHSQDGVYVMVYSENKFLKKRVEVVLENDSYALIEPCIESQVAKGSESKLSVLPYYDNIEVVGNSDGK